MPKVKQYELSSAQIKEGIGLCKKNVGRLLQAALTLLEFSPDISYCLFKIAVEEYGKMKILEELEFEKSEGPYFVSSSLFKGHQKKFNKALESLAQEGITFHGPIVLDVHTSNAREIFENPLKKGLMQEEGSSMDRTYFSGTGLKYSPLEEDISYLERFNILYINWDDERKNWIRAFENWNEGTASGMVSYNSTIIKENIDKLSEALKKE